MFNSNGATKRDLQNQITIRNLTMFIVFQANPGKNSRTWGMLDISLISLNNSEMFKVIPSKIFESMATGLPMVVSVPKGEATDLIEKYNAGLVCKPENAHSMFTAISDLYDNKELYNELSANSANAASNFKRDVMAKKMLTYIEELN